MLYKLPWSSTLVDYNGAVTNTSGLIDEREVDLRPTRGKTPKAKWRPPTGYSRTIETGRTMTYTAQVRDKYRLSTSNGRFFTLTAAGAFNSSGGYYVGLPTFPSNLENQAIIKARLKLKNQQINLGNAFGERAQCARLIGDNAIRIAEAFNHVRRRNFFLPSNKRPKPIDFHKAYLELQYGVKPLMSDVYGACTVLENKEKDAERGHVTVKANAKSRTFAITKPSIGDGVGNTAWLYDIEWEAKHNGFIRLDFVQDNPLLASLNSLGVTNPLEVAWELTPYSFVVDWFVPIGDWINQLDATLGWRFKAGSFSAKSTRTTRPVNGRLAADPNKLERSGYAIVSGSGRAMVFNRKIYGSAPLPSLPSFSKLNKKSVDHAANGIALLTTALAGWTGVR